MYLIPTTQYPDKSLLIDLPDELIKKYKLQKDWFYFLAFNTKLNRYTGMI